MCIFDIDNTLTHGADAEKTGVCPDAKFLDTPPPHWPPGGGTTQTVKDIIAKCREKGYGIAIATAEDKDEYDTPEQRAFLKALDPLFDAEFINTSNFQDSCDVITSSDNKSQLWCKTNEFADKTKMYIDIMNYQNIQPSEWKNSIVFDDALSNLTTAGELGFKVCQASPECGGVYCSASCALPKSCLNIIV